MFGNELRKARLAAGLTQEELSFKAEIHPTYLRRLEADKKSPTLRVYLRLCRGLEIKPSQLMARIEENL